MLIIEQIFVCLHVRLQCIQTHSQAIVFSFVHKVYTLKIQTELVVLNATLHNLQIISPDHVLMNVLHRHKKHLDILVTIHVLESAQMDILPETIQSNVLYQLIANLIAGLILFQNIASVDVHQTHYHLATILKELV